MSKRKVDEEVVENEESIPGEDEDIEEESEGDDDSTTGEENEESMDDTVNVEFEALPPEEEDFNGVKKLVRQIFLKTSEVDISVVTEALLKEKEVTVIIRQVSDDNDDEDDDVDEVYGVCSLVPVAQDVRAFLKKKLDKVKDTDKTEILKVLLSSPTKPLGWIVNERFINLSPQLSVPSFESILKDMKKVDDVKDLTQFIMVCKILKCQSKGAKKETKSKKIKATEGDSSDSLDIIFQNAEEEILSDHSLEHFDYNVSQECDNDARTGNWDEDDAIYAPHRRVLLMDINSLTAAVEGIKKELKGNE